MGLNRVSNISAIRKDLEGLFLVGLEGENKWDMLFISFGGP